ncbi:hypothetical protein PT181_00975 [Erysipelothrix rhusiopathiae]|nr:hypothetical protein [Erysipelothrix rhusiopathiae]MDE8119218.1 hypothetical protein [Erysipelothrix rhusiopathiae]MDE8132766.1 hypothetical protein [Erysipelothrix rhusiopathiae]MDE8146933.1 hypothetical protein [Erysipelothrix rhusiopathiae]MDE8194372.1 hypothetical protein [Erysipelothrix rhusiopathiae]
MSKDKNKEELEHAVTTGGTITRSLSGSSIGRVERPQPKESDKKEK